jgi:serine/threonine protein kinase/WD40 repeat protein
MAARVNETFRSGGEITMNPADEEAVFADVLALPSAERPAHLDQACGQDARLRERVNRLLLAHQSAEQFMAEPAVSNTAIPLFPPTTEKCGDKIGPYKLLQQIGEGGCGVVYMAEQGGPLRRRVALKVIKLGMNTRQVIGRFEAERQALALMDHPNIAKVFDAGATETGRPYFVMELVRGIKLTEYCDQNDLPTRERLELFIQVCHAIQHAHQKGIIHRDIKPSNILVTLHDGVPLPKVIDFGIAKATGGQVLTDQTLFTAFEQFIGTPAYMSPEQAEMSGLDVDTRTDVYALGVLLYELLTGTTPFDPGRLMEAGLDGMRRTIRETEPVRPSSRLGRLAAAERTSIARRRRTEPPRLLHQLRGDLDWVVMKCLEKDRRRRYENVGALAADVENHLAHRLVTAAAPTWRYLLVKFVRRNRIPTAFMLLLLIATAVSTWLALRANQARALAQRREAEARENLWSSYLTTVRASRLSGQLGRRFVALEAAAKAAAIRSSVELRSEAASAMGLVDLRPIRDLLPPAGSELWVATLDPRCEFYACVGHVGGLRVRRVNDGREVFSLAGREEGSFAIFSPDGRYLAARAGTTPALGDEMQVWERNTWRPLLEKTLQAAAYCFDFHPQLPLAASIDGRGQACFADLASGRTWSWSADARLPNALGFRPHTNHVAISSVDRGIRLHEIDSGEVVATIWKTNRVWLLWSANGRWLIGHDEEGRVFLWDFSRGGVQDAVFDAHHQLISHSSFDPEGEFLLTQSWDGTTALWSLASRDLLLRWGGGDVPASFSADGRRLGPCFTGGTARLLEVERAPEHRVLPANPGPVDCNGAFSPDGRWVVVPGADGLECWDLERWTCAWVLPVDEPHCIIFCPDGGRLVVSSKAGLHAWPWILRLTNDPPQLGSVQQLTSFRGNRIEYSLDGSVLVSAQADGLRVLSSRSAEPILLPMEMCSHTSVSPDGIWAVATPWTGGDSTLRIWELSSSHEVLRLEKTQGTLQFSPDGRWLVLATADWIQCRAAGTWESVARFPLERGLGHMALSTDSQWCAVQQGLQQILLCEMPTLKPILTLDSGLEAPMCFSPDNRLLLTRRNDGRFCLWDLGRIRQQLTAMGLGW